MSMERVGNHEMVQVEGATYWKCKHCGTETVKSMFHVINRTDCTFLRERKHSDDD
jgi:ribosomal protein L37AE/L43A